MSRLRFTLFEEDTSNALIQQTQLINNVFTSTWQNVGLVRNRGVELVGELKDVFVPGLTLSNSLTYVDSKILSNPGFQSATGSFSEGMWAPYVPQWRDTAQAIWRPNENRFVMYYTAKSKSSVACSSKVSGTPAGAVGTMRSRSPGCSARWIRRSISLMLSR